MQNYKELKVWKKSHAFALNIYQATICFPKEEMYGLTSQIRRSSSSVPTNIAEGCGRWTKADTLHFFQVSLGSANEAEHQLLLARDLGYIDIETQKELESQVGEVRAMIISLINKMRNTSLTTQNS